MSPPKLRSTGLTTKATAILLVLPGLAAASMLPATAVATSPTTWRALYRQGLTSHRQNQFAAAEIQLQEALRAGRAARIPDQQLAGILNDLAQTYIARHDYRKAERVLKTSLKAQSDRYGNLSPLLVPTWRQLSLCYEKTDQTLPAAHCLEQVLAIEKSALGSHHRLQDRTLRALATILLVKALHKEALPYCRELVALDKEHGIAGTTLPFDLNMYATALAGTGQTQASQAIHDQVSAILSEQAAPDDPLLVPHLFVTAPVLLAQGKRAEAIAALEKAATICRRSYPDPTTLIGVLQALAKIYREDGNLPEVQTLYGEIVSAAEKRGPAGLKDMLQGRLDYALLLLERHDRQAATNYLKQTEVALKKYRITDPAQESNLWDIRSRIFEQSKQLDKAEAAMKQRLACTIKASGAQSRQTVQVLRDYGVLLDQQLRLPEAEKIYLQALAILRVNPNLDDCTWVPVRLAQAYQHMHQPDKAIPLYRFVIDLRQKLNIPSDFFYQACQLGLASCYSEKGDYSEAARQLKDLLELQRLHPGALKIDDTIKAYQDALQQTTKSGNK